MFLFCYRHSGEEDNEDSVTKFKGPEILSKMRNVRLITVKFLLRTWKTLLRKHEQLAHRLRLEMVPTDLTSISEKKPSAFCYLIASLMNSCLYRRALTDRRNKAERGGESRFTLYGQSQIPSLLSECLPPCHTSFQPFHL